MGWKYEILYDYEDYIVVVLQKEDCDDVFTIYIFRDYGSIEVFSNFELKEKVYIKDGIDIDFKLREVIKWFCI